MASGPSRKEAPAEPFKRVLGLAVRAIAGDHEIQVSYAPGKPELDGKSVQLPEPSRVPSQREIAVIRGWADCLALTAACHDVKLHARLAPKAGPARAVFEAVERARIEALGANRMPGMAANLTARVEDQYGHGRYAEITERADAPLEDALALIVREQLTGAAPPETAKAMVDLWRPWIEERAGRTLSRLGKVADDQASFGRVLRDMLKTLDLAEEMSEGEREEGDEEQEQSEGGEQQAQDQQQGQDAEDQASEEQRGEGEEGEPVDSAQDADADQFDADADSDEMADAREPWRPNFNVLDNPEAFGYKVFSRNHDEEIAAENLSTPDELERLQVVPRQGAAPPAERGRAARQQAAAQADGAAEPRLGLRPRGGHPRHGPPHPRRHRSHARAVLQARARCHLPRHGRHAAARQLGQHARAPDHGGGMLRRHPGAHAGALRREGRDPGLHHQGLEGRAGARGLAGSRQAAQPRPPQRPAPHHLQVGGRTLAPRQALARPDDARRPAEGEHRRRGAGLGASAPAGAAGAPAHPDDDLGRRAGRRFHAVRRTRAAIWSSTCGR